MAKESGALQRRRKVDMVAFFWVLLLGFGASKQRTLASLRRAFGRATGKTLVPSAFYDRFTPALAKLMKRVLLHVLEKAGLPKRRFSGCLAAFKDVLAADSTVIRLHDLLQSKWPACRTNHTLSALKAHVIMSVVGKGASSVKVTSQRVHDGPVLRAGKWVKDRLLLFDLGYYRFQLFARIGKCGGYFLTRLKDNANPVICGVHRTWRGNSVALLNQNLQEVLGRLKRGILDVDVELVFRRKAYWPAKARRDTMRCRLVGVRNEETGKYHLYLTNVPVEVLSAEEVGKVYGARWLIELLFRELKSQYELEAMPSSKAHIVETLLYAAFLTLVVSRTLLGAMQRGLGQLAKRCPAERWAAIFRGVAGDILAILLYSPKEAASIARRVIPMIRREAVDPNAGRALLLARTGALQPI
jgi:IS4 transposase